MKVELWHYENNNIWTFDCNTKNVLCSGTKISCLSFSSDDEANPLIVLHVDHIPARVDKCGKDIWLVNDEYAKLSPSPIISYGEKESHTIFTRENVNAPV